MDTYPMKSIRITDTLWKMLSENERGSFVYHEYIY